jgi:uncharacterized protein GlcG (DUF336 family)
LLKTVLACAGVVALAAASVATAQAPAPLPIPFAGGDPIFVGGKVVGAIGVTGAQTSDENVAHARAVTIGGKLPGK